MCYPDDKMQLSDFQILSFFLKVLLRRISSEKATKLTEWNLALPLLEYLSYYLKKHQKLSERKLEETPEYNFSVCFFFLQAVWWIHLISVCKVKHGKYSVEIEYSWLCSSMWGRSTHIVGSSNSLLWQCWMEE